MTRYKQHDYHKDWVKAKKDAKLDDKLFKSGLGGKLDDMNKLYIQMFKEPNATKAKALAKKHSDVAIKVQAIVKAYRQIVIDKGSNPEALKVLASIDENKIGNMIWDMALDKHDILTR